MVRMQGVLQKLDACAVQELACHHKIAQGFAHLSAHMPHPVGPEAFVLPRYGVRLGQRAPATAPPAPAGFGTILAPHTERESCDAPQRDASVLP